MNEVRTQATRVAEALREQGATSVDAKAENPVVNYEHTSQIEVVFDGSEGHLEAALNEVPAVYEVRTHTEPWPGGGTRVSAHLGVLEGGSSRSDPGGSADTSDGNPAVPVPEGEASADFTYYGSDGGGA